MSTEAQTFLADPNNKTVVLEALKNEGFVILPQSDYQAEKNSIFKEQATQIETAFNEAATKLGIERPANTPVTVWAKTFADAAVSKLTATPPPAPPKSEDVKGNPMLVAQLKALQTETESIKQLFAQKEAQANLKIIDSSIVTELSAAKLGDTPEVQKAKLNALTSLIKGNHSPKVDANGNTIYHGTDGMPLVHANGQPKTAMDIAKEQYSFMLIPDAPKVEGLGLNGGVQMMTDHVVANKLDTINAEAAKKGYAKGSPDWKEFTDKSIAASKAKFGSDFKIM